MVERPRVSGEVLGRGSGVRAEGEVQGAKAKGEWVRPRAKAESGGLLRAEVPGQGHGMCWPGDVEAEGQTRGEGRVIKRQGPM